MVQKFTNGARLVDGSAELRLMRCPWATALVVFGDDSIVRTFLDNLMSVTRHEVMEVRLRSREVHSYLFRIYAQYPACF